MTTDQLPPINDLDLTRVTGGFLEEGDSGGWGDDNMSGLDTSSSWGGGGDGGQQDDSI